MTQISLGCVPGRERRPHLYMPVAPRTGPAPCGESERKSERKRERESEREEIREDKGRREIEI